MKIPTTLQSFLDALMRFRLPSRRFYQDSEKVVPAANPFGAVEWVLARPLYRFRLCDLSQVPRNKRGQALQIELERWNPYASFGSYVAWRGAQALVWCWDRELVNRAVIGQRLNPERVLILPETTLHAPPLSGGGLRLVRCISGFEGQLWRDGALLQSRWWARLPTAEEWLNFQRDGSVQPELQQTEPPAAEVPVLTAAPWISAGGMAGDETGQQRQRLALALGALLLAVVNLWYGIGFIKLAWADAAAHDELARIEKITRPLTEARGKALDLLARVDALRSLDPYPNQLLLMAKVADALPKDTSSIREWNFQHGHLKITVISTNAIAASALITALQGAGPFRDVKLSAGQDAKLAVLEMEVGGTSTK